MAIELSNVSSGYSTGVINDNFEAIEAYINDNLLNRDGTGTGEPNQMELNLDMNGFALLNVSVDVDDPGSLLTVGDADSRYINVTGDSMTGALNVQLPVADTEPARKDQLDTERSQRQSADSAITNNYQDADANLQAQISGGDPLEASAFSEISWHGQTVENSVTIPDNSLVYRA